MIKRTLWYALLVLLCCSIGVMVNATTSPKVKQVVKSQLAAPGQPSIQTQRLAADQAKAAADAELKNPAANAAPLDATSPVSSEGQSPDKAAKAAAWEIYERWSSTGEVSSSEKDLMEQYVRIGDTGRNGNPLDDIGGPDAYGYYFVDNLAGDTATYNWIELRGDPGATWISAWASYDDGMATAYHPIGFSFPFYGSAYTQFKPSSNGQIEFGATTSPYSYTACMTGQTTWGPAILPFMYDLHLQRGGDATGNNVVGYKNFGDYFVIEYDSVGFYSSTYTGSSLKFQVILYPNGKIKIQYNNMVYNAGASMGTVGITSGTATSYLQYRCYNNGNTVRPLSNGRALWFHIPPVADHDWTCSGITSPTAGGQYEPNSTATVIATFQNRGTSTESAPVKYSFNGGATVTEATAVLAPMGAETHTYAVQITMPATVGSYPLSVWVDHPLDPNPTNNTVNMNVTVSYCYDLAMTAPGTISGNTTGAGNNCALRASEEQIVAVTITDASVAYSFSLCGGSGWDTYMYLTDGCCGTVLAFDDDGCSATAESIIPCYTFAAPGTYYVDIEAFGSTTVGPWTLVVNPCVPCEVPCEAGDIVDTEPMCGPEYVDVTNGGCNSVPPVFGTIACGQTICGMAGNYYVAGTQYRDMDWFEFTLTQYSQVTLTGSGEFPIYIWIMQPGCPAVAITSIGADSCASAVVTAALYPATYMAVVGPSVWADLSCDRNYRLTLDCVPLTVPTGRCCYGDPMAPTCATNTLPECNTLSGTWVEGLDCTTPCPGCADFTLTAPGTISGNTTGAGDDCALRAGTEQTVAVTITDASLPYTFSLCPGAGWDTYLFITSGCCGTVLASNDDYCGLTSQIDCYQFAAPGTYFVTIEPYSSTYAGAWTLVVSTCVPPTGRCCYGDPTAPECAVNLQSECTTLGGIWTEGLDCATPCPIRPSCPTGSMYSQLIYLPEEVWTAATSDQGMTEQYKVYDEFTATGSIGMMRVWGLDLWHNGSSWQACTENPMPFEINFYEDNAGTPGTLVATRNAVGVGIPDVTYAGYQNYMYDLAIEPPVNLAAGWVAVQGVGDPNCWFLWMGSQGGNLSCLQWDGTTLSPQPFDVGFCLVSGECDPVSGLTVYPVNGDPTHAWLKFNAPVAGDYKVYSTIFKNNDGNPDGGADANFVLETTLNVAAAGPVTWTDPAVVLAYKNYVVTHNCVLGQPLGRCCYGDPTAPTCEAGTEYAYCQGLGGTWSYNVDCTTPCPLPSYCEAGSSYAGCDEYIGNVAVGDINNTTTCIGGTNYADYTALTTNMTIGTGYPITVTNGFPYASDQCGIWVDWNHDMDFDDADETIAVLGTPGNGPYTGTITPPVGADLGSTRMRVRILYTGTVSPCGIATYGEVEDYTLIVQ